MPAAICGLLWSGLVCRSICANPNDGNVVPNCVTQFLGCADGQDALKPPPARDLLGFSGLRQSKTVPEQQINLRQSPGVMIRIRTAYFQQGHLGRVVG